MYWQKIETNVRVAHARHVESMMNQGKKTRLSSQSSVSNNNHHSVGAKWEALHKSVTLYDGKIADVHLKFKKLNPHSENKIVFIDTVIDKQISCDMRNRIIHHHLRQKKRMHILNEEATMLALKDEGCINEELVRDFLKSNSATNLKISSLQLMEAESLKVKQKESRLVAHSPFMCFTGKNLGDSWESIIRQVVETDMQKNNLYKHETSEIH